jgi:hypothetical protein
MRVVQLQLLQLAFSFGGSSATNTLDTENMKPNTFVVSNAGDDTAAGTLAAPFCTLHRARDAVRALKARSGGVVPAGGITVELRGGVYTAPVVGEVPLALSAADSGRPGAPIVWRARGGEAVLISAGVEIPPSAFAPRPVAPAGTLQANLSALGITDLGAVSTDPNVSRAELFYGGQPMTLARWPNKGSDSRGW